jgi:uncharacterized protein (TIGR02246 family)
MRSRILINSSRLMCAFTLFSMVMCGAQGEKATDSSIRQAIDQGNAQYIKFFAHKDAAGLASLYDEDAAKLEAKGTVVRGRPAIKADFESFIKEAGPVTVTIETVEVWVVDDRAVETGKWTYAFTPIGKEKTTLGGRYVAVWKKQKDGGWKIITDMDVPKD